MHFYKENSLINIQTMNTLNLVYWNIWHGYKDVSLSLLAIMPTFQYIVLSTENTDSFC